MKLCGWILLPSTTDWQENLLGCLLLCCGHTGSWVESPDPTVPCTPSKLKGGRPNTWWDRWWSTSPACRLGTEWGNTSAADVSNSHQAELFIKTVWWNAVNTCRQNNQDWNNLCQSVFCLTGTSRCQKHQSVWRYTLVPHVCAALMLAFRPRRPSPPMSRNPSLLIFSLINFNAISPWKTQSSFRWLAGFLLITNRMCDAPPLQRADDERRLQE